MPPRKLPGIRILLSLLFTAAAIALVRDTLENGHDFTVFWKGAQSVLRGETLYSLNRDGGMVFKYPPWILPFFLPFGLMPLELAKFCWGCVEVLSLVAVVQWLRIHKHCQEIVWVGVLISYWGLWAVHALDGQVALVMLAASLWAWTPEALKKSWPRSFVLIGALSTKIFTLFPLFQNRLSRAFLVKLLGVFWILALFSIPALWVEPSHSLVSLMHSWMSAATSGGALLSSEQIRGRYNPSLTRLILSLAGVPSSQAGADIAVALGLALVLGLVWKTVSSRLSKAEAWLGWLALAPVIHPLPWWHLFVFSFPLSVVSLDRAFRFGRERGTWLLPSISILGVILITACTEKVFGSAGLFLEMACAKSWGVLLVAGVLVWGASKNQGKFVDSR